MKKMLKNSYVIAIASTLVATLFSYYVWGIGKDVTNPSIKISGNAVSSVLTVGSGNNIMYGDPTAGPKVDYFDVAHLDVNGLPFEGDGAIIFTTQLSKLIKPFVFVASNDHQFTFQCTQEAISSYGSAIKLNPKFPFAYFYLGSCEKKVGNPKWKLDIDNAKGILKITTTIEGHNTGHDYVLAIIIRDYGG